MTSAQNSTLAIKQPLNWGSQAFADQKYEIYEWLREEAPVSKGRISLLNVFVVSRYDDCLEPRNGPFGAYLS